MIFEYTTEDGEFEPEHQKLFLRAADSRKNIEILDLLRLNPEHLEYLINVNIRNDFELTNDYYLSWNGNLRTIRELKYGVGVGRSLDSGSQIGRALTNLEDTIEDHIGALSATERAVLAIILANVEAIDRPTLLRILGRLDPHARPLQSSRAIEQLDHTHAFVRQSASGLSISNDTIAEALRNTARMQPPLVLAERELRDHYGMQIQSGEYDSQGLSNAVRQYFRLCAGTKDVLGLLGSISRLGEEIRTSENQSAYIEIVHSAIETDPALFKDDQVPLVHWAASLAYETGDWPRAEELLRYKTSPQPVDSLMRAYALQEVGKHAEALAIATDVRAGAFGYEIDLAADLLQTLIVGCQGQHLQTRISLEAIIADDNYRRSPLLGYAYRFFEIVDGFDAALPRVRTGIDWFTRFGFLKSAAYSKLSAAVMTARTGDIAGAREMHSTASSVLSKEVRAQHIILNNQYAIELLSENPDLESCRTGLTYSLGLARDDFCELTILTNLGLAHLALGELESAVDCADKCVGILETHDFADTSIYWSVCFNLSLMYGAADLPKMRDAMLEFPAKFAAPRTDGKGYWPWRFGAQGNIDPAYSFLATKKWHPLYLSNWIIDFEGLQYLMPRSLR